jgi:hypothetical protein
MRKKESRGGKRKKKATKTFNWPVHPIWHWNWTRKKYP